MAGDNVALSGGLALIKLVQQILELFKTGMETKSKQLGNRIKELEAKLKEGDKANESLKEELDKCKNQKNNLDHGIDELNKISPERIRDAIKAKKSNGKLTNDEVVDVAKNLTNNIFEGHDFSQNEKKSITSIAADLVRRSEDSEKTNSQGKSARSMSFNGNSNTNNKTGITYNGEIE